MAKTVSLNELKEQEREARRDFIISAAERVFAKKAFNTVTIRDIAKEAGISHALIYRYFPDQQSLFVEACIRRGAEIVEFVNQLIDDDSNIKIEKVMERFIQFLAENDQYFRMMTHFVLDGSLNAEMLQRLNTAERVLLAQFDRIFAKTNDEKSTRMLSHALFAAMNGIIITFRSFPGRSREEALNHMLALGKIIAEKFKQ
ncbi:MAG: TetR/AcrR family transcriptional regulator [Deltaproteobacteria bacterium HGW-Deltaproteobacteria-2]|jgi:AcrR family transcriptional regulator|nr:MAG: TetR/AcrR family transcriptional regulator [Deltaproteobacteria bacterium HGW-Deltaproteobacteria-2]